jgi:hypothetical protein
MARLLKGGIEMTILDLLGKTIYLEDTSGDTLMIIQISEQGRITRMDNCEIADQDTNEIRIQQIREVK